MERRHKITLPKNRAIAISKMISLEKKFDRQPDVEMKYVETKINI